MVASIKLKDFALKLLEQNVNVLPTKIAEKYPKVNSWKQYQERMILASELQSSITKDIDGIGVVTGKISQNLEVLDFDNKLGNIEEIFNDFKNTPDIAEIVERCIIERTQSGGFHIFYRCENIEGNQKLAAVKKPDGKYECIIETRGEGGFCVIYPSKNYEKIFGSWAKIPVIYPEERDLLLQTAKSYNQEVKKKEYSEKSNRVSLFEEKPGDAYTNSTEGLAEAKALLISAGWNLKYSKGDVEHWQRPGAKTRGIDATFRDKVFYVFSTNASPFEANHSYTPFSILIILKFNDDVKEAVQYLIHKGYGRCKQIDEKTKDYEGPTDQFWKVVNVKKIPRLMIDKVNFIYFLEQQGYAKMYIGNEYVYIRVSDNIVSEVTISHIKDHVLQYIDNLPTDITVDFTKYDLRNVLLTESNKLFAPSLMECIVPKAINIMRDTQEEAYFFFRNCWVRANKSGVQEVSYSKMDGYIWANQKIDKDYSDPMHDDDSPCEFEIFLKNICNDEVDRLEALETAIGYLLHTYKDPATAKAIIFCDQGSDKTTTSDESNGRSGKSLVGKALGMLRREVRIDARNFSMEKNFAFQQVNFDTQFINFNDVDKRFNFEKLYSIITDAITIEKKNRDEFSIPFENAPKVLISTNYTIEVDGTSGEDRKFEIEFSDHYSISHKPQDEFGHRFFDDWSELEWNKFYSYMMSLTSKYIREGLKNYIKKNLSRRLLLQETCMDFMDFMEDRKDHTKFYTGDCFKVFVEQHPEYKKLTPNTFGRWLKKYAIHNKINWKSSRDDQGRFFEFIYNQQNNNLLEFVGSNDGELE